jgi:hypothetical protein
MKKIFILSLIIISCLISGCGHPYYQAYKGDPLPPERIARISSELHILGVDGSKTDFTIYTPTFTTDWSSYRFIHVDMLPGYHTIVFSYDKEGHSTIEKKYSLKQVNAIEQKEKLTLILTTELVLAEVWFS